MRFSAPLTPLLLSLLVASAVAGGAPPDVLIVVNGSDPSSVAIGEHYRTARSIPPRNVCRLDVPAALVTDLATYKTRIEGPIRDHILREGLAGRIDLVVCTRGIPIVVRVRGGPLATAALLQLMDTEISGLDRLGPVVRNPYLHGEEAFSHATSFDGRHLYLVTFLTGFTPEDATALVDRALLAEREPPRAPTFHFQDARGPASGRNRFYPDAVAALREQKVEAFRHPAGADGVVDRDDVMVWMSGGSYSGLTEKGIASNTYPPGAIVDMLESFGAVPRNFDPEARPSQVPVTWFVRHGITGIHGAVAEPLAHTFPDTSLPLRYLAGFSLAEAFHGSLPFVYWQNLVIGDPLCTPFARRPAVTVRGLPEGKASGTVTAEVGTSGAPVERIELLVDGLPAGEVAGASGRVEIDTRRLANGIHGVLAVARGPAPLRTAGWTAATLEVENDGLRPVAAEVADGRVRVRLSRDVRPGESPPVRVAGPAGPLAGSCVGGRDHGEQVFVPETELPAGRMLRVSCDGAEETVEVSTPPASLRIEAPDELRVGVPGRVVVVALDEAGEPIEASDRPLELRCADPPTTLGGAVGPRMERAVELIRAGTTRLVAVDRRSGISAERPVRVVSGEPATFDLRAGGSVSVGTEFEVRVRALDRYRNRVEGATGTYTLVAVLGSGGTPCGTLVLGAGDRGEGVIRGVRLEREGRQLLVLLDGNRRPVGRTVVNVTPARLASWLVLGPLPFGGEPGAALDEDRLGGEAEVIAAKGSVHAGRIWRERTQSREPVDLSRAVGGRGAAVIYALCWIRLDEVPEDAQLRVVHDAPCLVCVEGRQVYRSTEPAGDDGAVVRDVPLREGWNRVLVKEVRTRRACSFRLRVTDAAGNVKPAKGVRLAPPEGLRRFAVSGRVTSGKSGIGGLRVRIEGPERREAVTGDDGRFALGDLPAGTYSVAPVALGLTVDPVAREVTLGGEENAVGVDFTAVDAQRPVVTVVLPRDGVTVARWFRVVVHASDNVGVVGVRLVVDGEPVGEEVRNEPFEIPADMKPVGKGKHQLRVEARDAAGNTARSDPIEVEVELDETPPRIHVARPRRGKTVVGRWMKVEVRVRDDVDVARIDLLVDGKRLGKPFEAVREIDRRVDLRGVKDGDRTLIVRATDTSGNTAEVEVPFRKR